MRTLLFPISLGLLFTACRCGPDVPSPVTFRIDNPLQTPIFVDATDALLGLKVKRNVNGDWIAFVEEPQCECLSCELACNGCDCDPPNAPARVMKVEPGGSAERVWSGVVQVSANAACSGTLVQGPACLRAENPPLNETFRVELCYALSAPGAETADAGVAVPGNLPQKSIQCVERPFTVADGVVTIAPQRGADCAQHSDCTGQDELCFNGGCTAACPATGFPQVGGSWQVRIPEPTDQGFFTFTQDASGMRWEGTGAVGSVRYDNNTVTLRLNRTAANGATLTGTIYVTLPPGISVPFTLGETVHARVWDTSTDQNPENRGVVIRDPAGTLLLAAETAQKAPVLAAEQVLPFSVSRADEIVGCAHTECGKNLFRRTRFEVGAEAAVELEPGRTAELVAQGQVWKVANVGNEAYATTWCTLDALMPYVIANQRVEAQP